MKKQLSKIIGLFCYLIILGLLFDFNWVLIFSPKPFFSVILGMVILTASQYKKGSTKEDIAVSLRWNLIFSSFLTTLVSVLSLISSKGISDIVGWGIIESLLPMLYGSILYLILNILTGDNDKKVIDRHPTNSVLNNHDLVSPAFSQRVFIRYELTNRECHVALKILENLPNKEIAAQLYISEATVKKHVQNIYQKFGATDRNSFKEIYLHSIE